MVKFKISSQVGSLQDSKNIGFELTQLPVDKSLRIRIENATDSVVADIVGLENKYIDIEKNVLTYKGFLNLNIPEHSSQSAISVFANVFESNEGNYKLIDICPTVYNIEPETEQISFSGKINIDPDLIAVDDICKIEIDYNKNDSFILSINDRRFKIISDEKGYGSFHIRGRDVLDNFESKVIQRFPIYYYLSEDSFTRKKFSGFYLNILPKNIENSIRMHFNEQDAWNWFEEFIIPRKEKCNIAEGEDPRCYTNECTPSVAWTIPGFCATPIPITKYQACCFPDGTCENLTVTNCRGQGGVPYGEGTTCVTTKCPGGEPPTPITEYQACCFPDGSCENLTVTNCIEQGGKEQGEGTVCTPTMCKKELPVPPPVPPPDIPTNGPDGDDGILVDYETCRIMSDSEVLLSTGAVLHVFVGIDGDILAGETGYNILRSFTVETKSSLATRLIVSRYLSIGPKKAEDDFTIIVEEDLFQRIKDILDKEIYKIYVCIMESRFNHASFEIIDTSAPDEYISFFRIIARDSLSLEIKDWLSCQYTIFYEKNNDEGETNVDPLEDLNITKFEKLPFITDDQGNLISTIKSVIASNSDYVETLGQMFIYIISEAIINSKSQLFLYSFVSSREGSEYPSSFDFLFYTQHYGWKQLTSSGNNKNPRIRMDKNNNLHIFWESDRTGTSQLYYGVLGPSSMGFSTSVLSSLLDKKAELLQTKDISSFTYWTQDILKTIEAKETIDNSWTEYEEEEGEITISNNNKNVKIFAKVIKDTAIAFTRINAEQGLGSFGTKYSQINYQLSFDFVGKIYQDHTTLFQDGSLFPYELSEPFSENDIEYLYEGWKKDNFLLSIDSEVDGLPVYLIENNRFVVGEEIHIYDRFIPFVGSYKNENLDDVSLGNYFSVIASGDEKNLRHFMIGLMPEKVCFKATNLDTWLEYCNRLNLNPSIAGGYIPEKKEEIYTGKAKLVVIYNNSNSVLPAEISHSIIRKISEEFSICDLNNFKILVNYSKMFFEDISNFLNIYSSSGSDFRSFITSLSIFINDEIKFSESFLTQFLGNYNYFDIGLGIPSRGCFIADKLLPYNTSIYEDAKIEFNFNNITIGSPTFYLNNNVADFSSITGDKLDLFVLDVDCKDPSALIFKDFRYYFEDYDYLGLGMRGGCLGTDTYILTDDIYSASSFNLEISLENTEGLKFSYITYSEEDIIRIIDVKTGEILFDTGPIKTGDNWITVFIDKDDFPHSDINLITVDVETSAINPLWQIKIDVYKSIEKVFMQMPLTIEGYNKSLKLDMGNSNDIYLVWESNRDKYWNIFHTNSGNKNLPFRFETKITNTQNNSLCPSIAINDKNKRMIVWHEKTDAKYEIYSAKAFINETEGEKPCYNDLFLKVGKEGILQNEELFNEISFIYENDSDRAQVVHFRINFYRGPNILNSFIFSAFSYLDSKRWFLKNGNLSEFSSNGIRVEEDGQIEVVYVPDFLPQQLQEKQLSSVINRSQNITEKSLLCGVDYYVEVESYEAGDPSGEYLNKLTTGTIKFACHKTEANYWRENKDKKNWTCSAQGKTDLKISGWQKQSLFPDISSNIFDYFYIVWQGRSIKDQYIYGNVWDSVNNILYSSAQGFYDRIQLYNGHNSSVLADPAQNFYISSFDDKEKYVHIYKLPVDEPADVSPEWAGKGPGLIEPPCWPSYFTDLDSTTLASIGEIKVRIYEEDIIDSVKVNKDKILAVVGKQDIRFDITGITSAYAIRLRNAEDDNWSDWIEIKNEPTEEFNTYSINNERFIVSWKCPKANGIMRTCLQILTLYGRTETICIEFFINLDLVSYYVEFYLYEDYKIPVTTYEGYPILSETTEGNIYIKVYLVNAEKQYDSLRFNVIQQGINDLYNQSLTHFQEDIYIGSFKVFKEDGIFNKDGLTFITILFPEDEEAIVGIDKDPIEAYKEYKQNRIDKVLEIDSFNQFYDKDDNQFVFGNPKIFKT